ncbi:MAG: class I poly(R)-hydroxyalkanoic acid synthase [Rhodobacter sp.]|uniref:class I poly(R)-hydroxyalkanoic acid synthase n=1 Tax=Pararhodobacter sp. TaxID=2127056 RepID=UPI002CB115BF|nr:class I poly(R)-hydroxyalkanoic acid synthase [Pararhodobacter sp.]MCC0073096.1 class I poly(R)-hydroxyalkanoic acid synthase [Rhodobacter sp.]HPD92892.1 class I poly(R)-hydroxyalkanoic acid synthase [Pararhodobacter sp.]
MATSEYENSEKLDALNENLVRIEALTQRLIAAFARKQPQRSELQAPDPSLYLDAATAYWTDMVQNPSKILEQQVEYWGKTLKHFVEAQEALRAGTLTVPPDATRDDKRFTNPLWKTHPYFNYIKQQYLMSSDAIEKAIADLDTLDPRAKKRLEYFGKQIIDMMAPTNFLGTNPDALMRAVETEGESLVKGLENLVRDIEANDGELLVTLSDRDAFKVGGNIGMTEGAVVFRNRMFELIQYKPQTEQVHETPLLIFPPWINKFYILDLKPQNSLIKWIVEQGYTLFVVSWVNPGAAYADVGMDTYVQEGFLTAIDKVKEICGVKTINTIGYCIAGTTLSLTLALLQKRKDKSIKSATFFTALTDFSDQGETGVFLENDFVDGIEAEAREKGYLKSYFMTKTFSYLRSNDLIYGPAIRSYMLGEAPPAFDLLYWNGDGSNLPGRMTIEYLRGLCQENAFCEDGFEILGERLKVGDVKVPLCSIACETDHIAAWKSCFRGVAQMGSTNKTFILSESGHIAGIVNPPSKKKYGHYTSDAPIEDPDAWKADAEYHEGSWWPRWEEWLRARSGKMIAARALPDSVLAPAPGTYVIANPNAGSTA